MILANQIFSESYSLLVMGGYTDKGSGSNETKVYPLTKRPLNCSTLPEYPRPLSFGGAYFFHFNNTILFCGGNKDKSNPEENLQKLLCLDQQYLDGNFFIDHRKVSGFN